MRWLINLWRERQRSIDLQILWPVCKQEALTRGLDLDHAKVAFAAHAFHDPAWLCLGDEEIQRRINGLT